MEYEKFKKILSIIVINFAFMILLFISAFYPYLHYYAGMSITIYGWGQLIFGGFEGLIMVLIATILAFYYKIRLAIVFQIIGIISLFINIVVSFLFKSSWGATLEFGNILSIVTFCGFIVNLVPLIKHRYLEKEVAKEKFQKMLKRTHEGVNFKTRLFGMIKVEKQINLETVQNMLKIPKSEVKDLIYDLVGEGKLEGEFQDDIFLISSDIDDFLSALDSSFQEWEQDVQSKEKKI